MNMILVLAVGRMRVVVIVVMSCGGGDVDYFEYLVIQQLSVIELWH